MALRSLLFLLFLALVPLHAASVSKQEADVFAKKIVLIQRQADQTERAGTRRTQLTEDEVNSWFAFQAQPLLPAGVSNPKVTIMGGGKVAGQATVDLDAIAKRRSTGGTLDPWSFIGGRVPVNVLGTLYTRDGMGRFELESADISGLPVPKTLLQELVSHYSRTPENPQGVRLDDSFALPAKIRQIEVGQGQAVIVQ
jgi:hypothetical protein